MNRLINRLRALFQRQKNESDMDEEMRAHVELRTQANIDSGMLPAALGLATICNYTNRPDEALALLANASSPDRRRKRGSAYILIVVRPFPAHRRRPWQGPPDGNPHWG